MALEEFFKDNLQLKVHYDPWPSAVKKEHDVIDKIKPAILKHGNPFAAEGDKLHNMITQANIPDELMVLARSSRDINQKEAIGNHEFTLTPRALFAPDSRILPYLDKSRLIYLLNKLVAAETP
ncbi:hypothetical protein Pcinc_009358 [Petrolisthes cinctipes]|uniref:Uncharacterized protein n=1 Tax=Petrolisthes cinctipes TaxID=88211 RepID=A0AAE1GBE3_PETCI|nr:hypothetical protein Pcinc_009358 [Petrolisthes cinctipes]